MVLSSETFCMILPRIVRFMVFCSLGAVSLGLSVGFNWTLVEVVGLSYGISYAFALIVQLALNYWFVRHLLFSTTQNASSVLFIVGVIALRVLDWLVYGWIVSRFGYWFVAVQIGNVVVFAIVRYLWALWCFSDSRTARSIGSQSGVLRVSDSVNRSGIRSKWVEGFVGKQILRNLTRLTIGLDGRRLICVGDSSRWLLPHLECYSDEFGFECCRWNNGYVCGFPASDVLVCVGVVESSLHPESILNDFRTKGIDRIIIVVPNQPWWRITNILRFAYFDESGNSPGHVNHWSSKTFGNWISENGWNVETMVQPFPWSINLCKIREE